MDHSPVLTVPTDPNSTVPTYDQATITHTAKVFTGFTYSDAKTNPARFYSGGNSFATQYAPMACWGLELVPPLSNAQTEHDDTGDNGTTNANDPKVVLGGQTIPSGQSCAQDVSDELDIISAHQNVAPFISRQLIQRFVTSNPSPAYIERVATVFESEGDLGDTLKAILTDTEARNPPALNGTDTYGKLREPILRLTAMWRAFNAAAPLPDTYGEISMIGGTNFESAYAQSPLESPTVFNFYTPDYQQPGTTAYAPELQITNASTIYSTINSYYNDTANAYQGMTGPPDNRPLIDLSSLTVNASNPSAMVATINANMLYGSMSSNLQSTLTTMIGSLKSNTTAQEKAWSAIYLTMLSPEYATQR
jgi:uncharacterized protein (DUF1800 family)